MTTTDPPPDLIPVWDAGTGQARTVTRAEAAAGLARYARTLGPGTPACGALEEQALTLARGNDPATAAR